MPNRKSTFGRIHQPEVHHLAPRPRQPLAHPRHIPLQPLFQSGKLAPVSGQSNPKQPNPQLPTFRHPAPLFRRANVPVAAQLDGRRCVTSVLVAAQLASLPQKNNPTPQNSAE
jgi:hypothetical protein